MEIYSKIKRKAGINWWSIVTGIASILSLIVILFSDADFILVIFSYLLVVVAASFCYVIYAIHLFTKNQNYSEFTKSYLSTRYEFIDAENIEWDYYRVIQAKRLFLKSIDIRFKWTGKHQPEFSSKYQTIGNYKELSDSGDYDSINLVFNKPIRFNETSVVHLKMKLSDPENISKPHVDYKSDEYVCMIDFHVILKYKNSDFNTPAKLLRKPINSQAPSDYEELYSVPFDKTTRSYELCVVEPEVGYFYRLEWKK